jgi:hypothetical protein
MPLEVTASGGATDPTFPQGIGIIAPLHLLSASNRRLKTLASALWAGISLCPRGVALDL